MEQFVIRYKVKPELDDRCDERRVGGSAVEIGAYRWISDSAGIQ